MESIRFFLETEHRLALDSNDYLYPLGAMRDNNRREKFNEKLKQFPGSVLDLGCAGGGFVKDCIDRGRIAVGLEGSDYDKKFGKFEWITIPDNLFTCDITKPFTLYTKDRKPFQFDIITLWEVFEHIEYKDLDGLLDNIKKHLTQTGVVFATISASHAFHEFYPEVELHRIRQKRDWWKRKFENSGFIIDEGLIPSFTGYWLRESRSNHKFILRKNG